MLEAGFCEIDGVNPAEAKARIGSPKSEHSKIGAVGGSKPSSANRKAKAGDEKCQFCHRADKAF
jgi:hypothetical protein